ncbi:zinc ribbon-containing protein [Clostridium sp. LBM24168]
MIYNSGDKPGKGTYICKTCGYKLELKSDDEYLPVCPVCRHTEFEKQ